MRSWLSVLITDAESKKVFDIPIAPSLYSLSNKMDNSLLAVRDINHKYIVVERILEIQEDTNKTLHGLVDSIDATNSSQQEVIDSLSDATKRLLDSSQVPSAVFQDPESSVDHSAVTPDNNRE